MMLRIYGADNVKGFVDQMMLRIYGADNVKGFVDQMMLKDLCARQTQKFVSRGTNYVRGATSFIQTKLLTYRVCTYRLLSIAAFDWITSVSVTSALTNIDKRT